MVGTHKTRHGKIAELKVFYKFVKLDKAQWDISNVKFNRTFLF